MGPKEREKEVLGKRERGGSRVWERKAGKKTRVRVWVGTMERVTVRIQG